VKHDISGYLPRDKTGEAIDPTDNLFLLVDDMKHETRLAIDHVFPKTILFTPDDTPTGLYTVAMIDMQGERLELCKLELEQAPPDE